MTTISKDKGAGPGHLLLQVIDRREIACGAKKKSLTNSNFEKQTKI